MKLVITRDIANVAKLNITPDEKQAFDFPQKSPLNANKTPKHLHKGTRITIGSTEKAEDLTPEEKEKVLWLHHSKAIVPADDKAVARIDKEVSVDIARQAVESKPKPSMEEAIAAAVATALAAAGIVKAK